MINFKASSRYMCIGTMLLLPFYESHAARPAGSSVVLTGWLHAFDLTMTDVVVEVIVNGSGQIVEVSHNGRFTLELPEGTEAIIRFDKPGHQIKELRVDTRNAFADPGPGRRHVRFAVVLDLKRHMGGWAFSGPVGSIGFSPDKGTLLVEHSRALVPQEQIMEF